MWIILLILIQLISSLNSKFCCDREFRIEEEYCQPLASVFEFKVLNSRKSVDFNEYNIEVVKVYKGFFQLFTKSTLLATRHYCVPEIRLYPGKTYLAITNSLRVKTFTVKNCFFELIQAAHSKVIENRILCWPISKATSYNQISLSFLILIVLVNILI